MPGLFCQANLVAGNMYPSRKNGKFANISDTTIVAVHWTVFLKLLFQSYKSGDNLAQHCFR